jgi:hypothetical protein
VKTRKGEGMTMHLNNAFSRNVKCWKPRKLDERTSGLYRVLQTHVNGTVTIELGPGVSERLNIRRIILHKE